MKYFIGYLTVRPGQRDAFMPLIRIHAVRTRQETGCVYFHAEPVTEDPVGVLLVECYIDAEAHRLHNEQDYMKAFFSQLPMHVARLRLETIATDGIEVWEHSFD